MGLRRQGTNGHGCSIETREQLFGRLNTFNGGWILSWTQVQQVTQCRRLTLIDQTGKHTVILLITTLYRFLQRGDDIRVVSVELTIPGKFQQATLAD